MRITTPTRPIAPISVQGDFTGGGYPGQESRDHTTRWSFGT